MNKAIEELWASYKDARKERAGKLLPKIRKKDMAEMSVRDLTRLVIDTVLGNNPDMDKPISKFTDEEWEEFGRRMEKRGEFVLEEFGFKELPPEE